MLDCQRDATRRGAGDRPSPCREAFEAGYPCRHEYEAPTPPIAQIVDTLLFWEDEEWGPDTATQQLERRPR
jgi:hypothetical protein